MAVPLVEHRDSYIYGKYEPGNGTRYTAVAISTNGYLSLGWLGSVEDGWIIASGMASQKAYLITKHEYLHPDYVGEKFDLRGEDAEMFTELLKAMLREVEQ